MTRNPGSGARPTKASDLRAAIDAAGGVAHASSDDIAFAFEAHNALTASVALYGSIIGKLRLQVGLLQGMLAQERAKREALERAIDDHEDPRRIPGEERGGQAAEQARPEQGRGEGTPGAGRAVQAPEQVGEQVPKYSGPRLGVNEDGYVIDTAHRILQSTGKRPEALLLRPNEDTSPATFAGYPVVALDAATNIGALVPGQYYLVYTTR